MSGEWFGGMGWIDAAALALVVVAGVRGLWIGMIREAFSLAALASACIAIRMLTGPFADWLLATAPIELAPLAATIFAGFAIGLGTLLLVGRLGALLRRGVHGVGLGFADRLGGALLGGAEGALVVALGMIAVGSLIGTDHPSIRDTRTLATLDLVASSLRSAPVDVSAPYEGDRG